MNFFLIKYASFATCSRLKNNIDPNNPLEVTANSVNPVVTYTNADLDKSRIFKDNKDKTGVYRWVNCINNKSYIGSGINLYRRLYTYYDINLLIKEDRWISRALLKNGYSNFKLEILEYCDKDKLIEREQCYIDQLKPEYNILQVAGSTLGYKHTEETLAKFRSRKWTDEYKAIIGAKHAGKTLSKETIEKIRQSRIGLVLSEETRAKLSALRQKELNPMFGKSTSEEAKQKMREANGTSVVVLNSETGETISYASYRAAAAALDCNVSTVSRHLKSGKLLRKIYKITLE